MVIPTTGIVFLFGAFVYIYLARRFWNCYKLENNNTAKLFSYAFLSFGLGYFIQGAVSLLLIESQSVWRIISPLFGVCMAGGYGIITYAAARIKFQESLLFVKTLFPLILILICIPGIIFFILSPPIYFYTDGTLNWEIKSEVAPLIFGVSSLFIVFSATVFFREAKKIQDKKGKIRAFGLGLALLWLIVAMVTDFFLLTILKVHPIFSDLNYSIMFLILAITLILTWSPPRPKWVKKIE